MIVVGALLLWGVDHTRQYSEDFDQLVEEKLGAGEGIVVRRGDAYELCWLGLDG